MGDDKIRMKVFLGIFLALILAAGISAAAVYISSNAGAAPSSEPSGKPSRYTTESTGIIINEVMTDNEGIYPADNGSRSDWAEFHNGSDRDISLYGYSLTDNIRSGAKWPFPNISIKAHGYLVVFLTGDSKSDLSSGIIHCSFKLSSKGETLYLLSPSGNIADSVDIPALGANVSYGRADGAWKEMANPTPGFENSDAGYSAYRQSMTAADTRVIITEVMTKNAMTLKDSAGNYSDWAEICNISGADFNLSGCGLSDDPNDPMKWRFPDVNIKPGQYLIVFCNGALAAGGENKELDANFRLSSAGATLSLSDPRGRLMDSVTAPELSSDSSYRRSMQDGKPTGEWEVSHEPSPGYGNDGDGFSQFVRDNPAGSGDIVISEVMASNNKYPVEGDKTYDFIEIENRGGSPVNLKGYGLTDDAANPAKFVFPDTTLQPGKQIVVIAGGLDARQSEGMKNLSAPFKLSRLGEAVTLFDPSGKLLDRYFTGVMPQNFSMGREEGKSGISYFDVPTPGKANGTGYAGITREVRFGKQAGKYDGAFELSLDSSDGAEIYYTTNGDVPSKNSKRYTGPITIDKTVTVRAKAYKEGYIESGVSTATYFIGTKHTLPVVSLATNANLLFDETTGIYMPGPNASGPNLEGANFYKDTEIPASFEMFDESGKQVFQQNIGLAMTGGLTLAQREQKSFAIFARSKYGQSTMAYPFFANRDYTEYKSLILRVGSREGGNSMITKLHNYVALGLVDGKMKVVTQAARPCVVYINGEYWGVYFLMEKRNKYMVAARENITDKSVIDKINLAKGSGGLVNNGSGEGYKAILKYVNSHDMTQQSNYDWVDARLDTDSYMDFMINEIYIANNDPGNMQFYQVPPDGKWIQIYQDLDISFYSFDALALRMKPSTTGSDIFNALLKNDGWRDRFIRRFAWALKNIYGPDRVTAMIDEAAGLIRAEIPAEHRRWKDLPTLENWESNVAAMKSFAVRRGKDVVNSLKQHLPLTQEQRKLLDDAIK